MTNQAVLYRSAHKWRTVAAFVAAAMIHFSAIVAASHRQPAAAPPETEFAPVDVELVKDPPSPLPTPVDSPVSLPPPVSDSEFHERSQPHHEIAKPKLPVSIREIGPTRLRAAANSKVFATHAPKPPYPYEARSRHITGSGVAVITVDPATGLVTDVVMERSIGSAILDRATIGAFKRWRFKPGSPARIRVPITFQLTGASF
jgi:TonB family protein